MRRFAAVAFVVLAACGKGAGGTSGSAASTEKAVVVKADDLYADYKKNEVAADMKYKDHRVRVVGFVESITKDAFDNMVVHIKATGSLFGVIAHLQDSEKPKVAGLSKDQAVVVECKGDGMVLGAPAVSDCTVLIEGKVVPSKK